MYRKNDLQRNVLIMADEVIFHAPTKHTLDPRMVDQSIIIAEEWYIRPALGFDYYEALINQKNKLITAGNIAAEQIKVNDSLPPEAQAVVLAEGDIVNANEYLTAENLALWKQFLWKLTAEVVMMIATPEAWIQFESAGVVHTSPPAGPFNNTGIATPDLKGVKWLMDKKMMMRLDPIRESMHQWICKQRAGTSSKYSLYDKTCDCTADGVAYKRKTNLVMGMYDDIDNTGNDCDC